MQEALRLSDPALYDTVAPEQRQAALEAALSRINDTNTSNDGDDVVFANETSREVLLRAVCDPWSLIRKKMVKIVAAAVTTADNNNNINVQSRRTWLVSCAERILKALGEQPWYAVDGFLALLHSISTTSTGTIKTSNLILLNNESRLRLVELSLAFCAHQQESVRETAADVVASLITPALVAHHNHHHGEQDAVDDDDNHRKFTLLLEQIEWIVTCREPRFGERCSRVVPNWWARAMDGCQEASQRHLLEQAKLVLATRGFGIARLFEVGEEEHQQQAAAPSFCALREWASSELAAVRFGCAALFAKKDLRETLSTSSASANNDDDMMLSPRQTDARLKRAICGWLLKQQSSDEQQQQQQLPWTVRETAAVAAGDILRAHLPVRFKDILALARRGGSREEDDVHSTTFTVLEAASMLRGVDAMASEKNEPVFDVRRACAQLLPLLCGYFVATAPTAAFVVDLLVEMLKTTAHATCSGTPHLAGTCSCCPAQNLLWFLTVRRAFDNATFTNDDAAKLSATLMQNISCCCPRVKLIVRVYGSGLGLNSEFVEELQQQEQAAVAILQTDVRFLADWIRLDPDRAFSDSCAPWLQSQLCTAIDTYLETDVQELIFTALHDAAHVMHHELHNNNTTNSNANSNVDSVADSPSQSNNNNVARAAGFNLFMMQSTVQTYNSGNNNLNSADDCLSVGSTPGTKEITPAAATAASGPLLVRASAAAQQRLALAPFLFAMDTRFTPPALQQDGSDALEDGRAWVHAVVGETSSVRRRRGSLVVVHGMHHAAFASGVSWSLSSSSSSTNTNRIITRLAECTAQLVDSFLNTGKVAAATGGIELACLMRAADATRSVMRAVGLAAVIGGGSVGVATTQEQAEAERLLLALSRPWMTRLERRLRIEQSSAAAAATKAKPPKKASEASWDDSEGDDDHDADSSSDDDETCGGVAAAGLIGAAAASAASCASAVTWEQEVEAAKAALRHLVHVARDTNNNITNLNDNNNNNNNNNNDDGGGVGAVDGNEESALLLRHSSASYEPARVAFVKECVAVLKTEFAESAAILQL